ncbi:MAG: CoB--CoM heterodisulfide reductase iron-sulfur subunit B family protein [bacterium]|nr:CoB--CoM heterodisulfide reductase iron-sulfur subunit B family protein [bacterium]
MSYLYYPGCCCSMKASGKAYEESLMAVLKKLGVTLEELKDWNCCGATMYMAIDQMQAFGMASRNLALAEQQCPNKTPELMAPCSACYVVMNKTKHFIEDYKEQVGTPIRNALKEAGFTYTGKTKVRHPLDILVNDIGLDKIRQHVKKPLKGLKVASYYGCLLVRPYSEFDDVHYPRSMDNLMEALGASSLEWPLKTRCCGGSMTGTVEDAGLRLSYIILNEAERRGADVVVTACPFCQTNLECFQQRIQRKSKGGISDLPILFFTQLVGYAMGIPERELGFHRLFVPFHFSPKQVVTEGVE